MAIKTLDINLDEAFRRYQSGKSLTEVAKEMGVCRTTLSRRFHVTGMAREQGATRRMVWDTRHPIPDISSAIVRYQSGVSMSILCKEFPGIGRRRLEIEFVKAGVAMRGNSQTKYLMYSTMSAAGKKAYTTAANVAKRGRPANRSSLERRAITMEKTMQLASRTDLLFAVWLARRGIKFTMQKAAGSYNIDIAIDELLIAIEIEGHRHRYTDITIRKGEERRNFLLANGWRLIEVRLEPPKHLLREITADNVIALMEQARYNEPPWGQYCVIWGNGELLTGSKDEGDDVTAIMRPHTVQDISGSNLCLPD